MTTLQIKRPNNNKITTTKKNQSNNKRNGNGSSKLVSEIDELARSTEQAAKIPPLEAGGKSSGLKAEAGDLRKLFFGFVFLLIYI